MYLFQVKGTVDYGDGTKSDPTKLITFYDNENHLGDQVSDMQVIEVFSLPATFT